MPEDNPKKTWTIEFRLFIISMSLVLFATLILGFTFYSAVGPLAYLLCFILAVVCVTPFFVAAIVIAAIAKAIVKYKASRTQK